LFGLVDARRMALDFHNGFSLEQLDRLIGGDLINGHVKFLWERLQAYVKTRKWIDYLDQLKSAWSLKDKEKKIAILTRCWEKAAETKRKREEALVSNKCRELSASTHADAPSCSQGRGFVGG
jgi:hypothetical protein